MSATTRFALDLLLAAGAGLAAILSSRVTERIRVPAPGLLLIAAAAAAALIGPLHAPPERTVEWLVTVALVCILVNGGMDIGRERLRSVVRTVAVTGIAGTFLTMVGAAVFVHLALGLSWYLSVLLATAIAPTDPAVVFSVLGGREIEGRSGTILEGESGANDPVGIALMTALLSAGGLSAHGVGHVVLQFLLQMGVGLAVGVLGGWGLLWFTRRISLPSPGLYPLRTLACALAIYGIATLAHGSGFLAVFVAGIHIGDEQSPYKREIEHFQSALASLGEIVAFVVLGLTIHVSELVHSNILIPGLVLAAVLALVVRPLLVGPLLVRSGLEDNERAFVLLGGLKGAVPILLGTLLLEGGVHQSHRLYGIVVIVVIVSVIVQGGLVPTVASALRVPMHPVRPQPWALGVRLSDEPDGAVRVTVAEGSAVEGKPIEALDALPEGAWISMLVRDGHLVRVGRDTVMRAGDEALVVGSPEQGPEIRELFERAM